jgi:hypothetical protein
MLPVGPFTHRSRDANGADRRTIPRRRSVGVQRQDTILTGMRRRHGDSAPITRFVRGSVAAHSRFARRLRSRPGRPRRPHSSIGSEARSREPGIARAAARQRRSCRARVSVLTVGPRCRALQSGLPGFAAGPAGLCIRCDPVSVRPRRARRGHAEHGWVAPMAECGPPAPLRACHVRGQLRRTLCSSSHARRRSGPSSACLAARAAAQPQAPAAHTPSGGPSRGGAAPSPGFPLGTRSRLGPVRPYPFPLAYAGARVRVCGCECAVWACCEWCLLQAL